MPAAQRVVMAHSLVRFRDYDPFTGSIASGRSTTLRNEDALSGFELHAGANSLFWGENMKVEVRRSGQHESMADYEDRTELVLASDVFSVKPYIDSRRRRFDDSAGKYEFVEPLRICITTTDAPNDQQLVYSIAQIKRDDHFSMFDSTSNRYGSQFKTCAKLRAIDLNRETRYAVVAVRNEGNPRESDQLATEPQDAVNTPIVLMLLGFGPALILFGIRMTRRDRITNR